MSVRLALVRQHALDFDERLPLYGWLEDVDFSRQLARFGRVVRSDATRGVHLGTKLGRSLGVPLGYSQIANPFYLMCKGTMGWSRALAQMLRNIAKNVLRSVHPEPWVDRRASPWTSSRGYALSCHAGRDQRTSTDPVACYARGTLRDVGSRFSFTDEALANLRVYDVTPGEVWEALHSARRVIRHLGDDVMVSTRRPSRAPAGGTARRGRWQRQRLGHPLRARPERRRVQALRLSFRVLLSRLKFLILE